MPGKQQYYIGPENAPVALDASGNAYLAGTVNADVFLTKYDASGNQQWFNRLEVTALQSGESVAIDKLGNAYIAGWTDNTPGSNDAGRFDAYLVKFDSSGNLVWTRDLGTPTTQEIAWAVAIDEMDNPYITGHTNDTPPPGRSSGDDDVFVAKYDASGNLIWFEEVENPGSGSGYSLLIDGDENIFLAGSAGGFFGSTEIIGANTFVAKFSVPEPSSLLLLGLSCSLLIRRQR